MSLLEQGKQFCLKQVAAGLNAFASVLSDELHSFQDLVVDSEGDEADIEEDTEFEDETGAEEDDDEVEDQRTAIDDEATDHAAPDDSELADFNKVAHDLQSLPITLRSEEINANICVWYFHEELSQSTLNGRNGSNACSMIAISVACFFARRSLRIPDRGILPNDFVTTFCCCMELGNRMYDIRRDSLPNRYLSIEEAVTLLPFTDITVTQPYPVRLEDDHEMSTICGQLGRLSENKTYFVTIVINEKTSLFMLCPPRVVYLDTHPHGIHGAVVVRGTYSNLSDFCKFTGKALTRTSIF